MVSGVLAALRSRNAAGPSGVQGDAAQQRLGGPAPGLLPGYACWQLLRDPVPVHLSAPARRGDELVGDPLRDVGGVWRWQSEDDVLEAGGDRVGDRVRGDAGLVVGDWQVDRAGDRGGVASDLGAVLVEQCAAADSVVDVAAWDVPQVGVLGDHAQERGGASANKDWRVGALDGFGVAERSGEVDVGAMEVEWLSVGPQPPDDCARFGEASYGVGGVVEGQAVCFIFAPGQRVAGS